MVLLFAGGTDLLHVSIYVNLSEARVCGAISILVNRLYIPSWC